MASCIRQLSHMDYVDARKAQFLSRCSHLKDHETVYLRGSSRDFPPRKVEMLWPKLNKMMALFDWMGQKLQRNASNNLEKFSTMLKYKMIFLNGLLQLYFSMLIHVLTRPHLTS